MTDTKNISTLNGFMLDGNVEKALDYLNWTTEEERLALVDFLQQTNSRGATCLFSCAHSGDICGPVFDKIVEIFGADHRHKLIQLMRVRMNEKNGVNKAYSCIGVGLSKSYSKLLNSMYVYKDGSITRGEHVITSDSVNVVVRKMLDIVRLEDSDYFLNEINTSNDWYTKNIRKHLVEFDIITEVVTVSTNWKTSQPNERPVDQSGDQLETQSEDVTAFH